jgi:hypothetical protein
MRLDHDPLDLIEAHLVAPAIAELRRAGRGMVCQSRRLFERPAILETGGDPGCPETMIAEFRSDPGRHRTPAAASAGTRSSGIVNGTRLEFMLKTPTERCGITARAVPRGVSA